MLLQTIVNQTYSIEFGEEYEMAALLLADGLLAQKEFEQAEELLKNTFLFNKNNAKILELLGLIKEKQ